MKKRNHVLFFLFIFTSLITGCTFELIQEVDPVVEDETTKPGSVVNGISDETINAIPIDLGEIGVSIDARTLAIYGYKPTKVSVAIEGTLSNYSQEDIIVDKFTHIATFKLRREDLSDDELKGFSNGVPITVTVYDDAGKAIESKTISRYIINTAARTIKMDTDLPRILKPLYFNPQIPYVINVASETGFKTLGFGADDEGFTNTELGILNGSYPFYLIPTTNFETDSTYKIKFNYLYTYYGADQAYLEADANNGENIAITWYDANPQYGLATGEDRFVLEQTQNGTVKIRLFNSNAYLSSDNGTKIFFDSNTTNDLEFNIFAANISWTFNDLGTQYSPAIIPPAKMDFAFQQTILNCSGASGDYEVGVTSVEKKITSMSYEESVNLFSSKTDSKSATVEASAEGKIFGVGVKVSASGTLSTETTTEFGKEKKSNEGIEFEESQEVSSSRNVTVLPYSAVEVFDVIQKLENVHIPFVQRFIIRGNVGNNHLTGPEIETQLIANRFGGVVTEIGSDYIVVSIRGSVNVANYFEYNNSLHDIFGACN